MIKMFEKKMVVMCCPDCGNEELIDYYNEFYCEECKEVYCYGDLETHEKIVGEIELEIEEEGLWIEY